jgi:diguanylate cyclase (GGDEF)-like protein
MAPAASDSDLTRTGQLVSLAYPVWDVMSFALTMRLLVSVGIRLPAVRLLAAAPVAWLIADTVYAVQLQYSGYTQDGFINVVWLLGYVLYGSAALHPSMRELTQAGSEPSMRLTRARLSLLTGASLIAPTLLLGQTVLSSARVDGLAIGIASTVLFLLVVLRMGGLVRQVEDQAVQLTVLAQRDGLTGIPNRRTWDSELPIAMDRARRDRVPLTIGLIDLDNFKRFNDEYGHQAGDRLLKSATAVWSGALRDVDLLCRYGGEEFGVILPGVTAEQALHVLDRLRSIVPLAQTLSGGLACWDGHEVSDDLVGRADRALYAAKDAGRDRVLIAPRTAVPASLAVGGAVPA